MEGFSTNRRLLLVASGVSFAAVLAAFAISERPGLGVGHYFYLPIVLLALASGPRAGALGGLFAVGLFALGVGLNSHLDLGAETLPTAAIRLSMFSAAGALTGMFAQSTRRLLERLETLAERDHLTGLYNARAFEASLAERFEKAAPFELLLCDMDGLKAINDRRGHQAGSDALQSLGAALSAAVREEDHVARVGGDEFAVLCSAAVEGGAQAVAERLCALVDGRGLRTSFGWASFPVDAVDPVTLYRTADERLYAEKARRKGLAALAQAG